MPIRMNHRFHLPFALSVYPNSCENLDRLYDFVACVCLSIVLAETWTDFMVLLHVLYP